MIRPAAVLVAALLLFPLAARADQSPLAGLTGFEVLTVYANPYDQNPGPLKADFARRVLARLRQAGLPVLDGEKNRQTTGRPRLVILIGVIPRPFCGPSKLYELELRLEEEFTRVRKPPTTERHEVWKRHYHDLILDPETMGSDMVEHALFNVDDFIGEFQKANPLRP